MPRKKRRVVVTGLGPITSIGLGKSALWHSLEKGLKNFSKVTKFDVDALNLDTTIVSEIKDFNPIDFVTKKEADRMDTFTQYAVASTLMAFEDAHLSMKHVQADRFAVIIGTAIGGIESLYDAVATYEKYGYKKVSSTVIPRVLPGLVASQIAMILNARGPNKVISTTCTSSTHAIGEAFRLIRNGEADLAVAGGAEACISPWPFIGFCKVGAMTTRKDDKASRPFDKHRDGFVMSEGAGALILEELRSAEKRGANIYAEIVGYGASADAFHVTAPLPDGSMSARAIKNALDDAQIEYDAVDYINAHGTSTKYNDMFETKAIKNVFGRRAYKIPVSSTKSMLGHAQGACGAIETIATILTIVNKKIHPTMNHEEQDPDCDLDYVFNKARDKKVNIAVKNSLGFGGNNAAIVIKNIS
ncbi:MAG: beta-ketoacyl-ACP synthase II [Candidatus Margulisbacteria bacterium]|nr:beta-ketoacyl-ACP synthase II [Candidatus Margulisiibacteriota bacterium]